jgi:sarcosine oxidase
MHMLPHERISPGEAQNRFPQFDLPENAACYFDPQGGYVRPDAAVKANIDLAKGNGATIAFGERLLSWTASNKRVLIRTDQREIVASKLILTTGAFASQPGLGMPIRIQPIRKTLFWYSVKRPARFRAPQFPVWIAKLAGLNFYGFPSLEPGIIKAAEDTGGQTLAVGGSGHGFKFATVAGEIAAELALSGKSKLQPEIFRLTRERIEAGASSGFCGAAVA